MKSMNMANFVGKAIVRTELGVGVYKFLVDDYELGIEGPSTLLTWRRSYKI